MQNKKVGHNALYDFMITLSWEVVMKIVFNTIIVLLLSGCASTVISPIPKGYTGDTVRIEDSFDNYKGSVANFYYLSSVDGQDIHHAVSESARLSSGKGYNLTASGASRQLPTKDLSLKLVGQIFHSAPISALIHAKENIYIEGMVSFTPKPGMSYKVVGELSQMYSAVWVEDRNGNEVTSRIEEKSENFTEGEFSSKKIAKEVVDLSALPLRSKLFLEIYKGESSASIIEKLGEPSNKRNIKGNFWKSSNPVAFYDYDGLGVIKFTVKGDVAGYVQNVLPLMKDKQSINALKIKIKEYSPIDLRFMAMEYHKLPEVQTEMLNIFAETIWKEMNSSNNQVIDAVSWLCKVLAKNNGSEFKSLLKDVSDMTSNKKLKKYADIAWQSIPNNDVEQFIYKDSE